MNFAVTFPGLPAGYCYTGDLNSLFQAALSVSFVAISDSYTQIIISETTPAPADQNKVWVQINGSGTPLGSFRYASGAWQRILGAPYYGVDVGVVNAIQVTFPSDFTILALSDLVGRVFLIKPSTTSTGNVLVQINSLPPTALRYFGAEIPAGKIVANSIIGVVYDGTQFQLITPIAPDPLPAVQKTTGEMVTLPGVGVSDTIAHNLGTKPTFVEGMLECVGAVAGFASGDVIQIGAVKLDGSGAGDHEADAAEVYAYTYDATEITVTRNAASNGQNPILFRKDTGVAVNFAPADWKFIFVAVKLN